MADPIPRDRASAARASWADKTHEERQDRTRAATEARVTVAGLDKKFDALGAAVLDRLDALQAEVAELRSARIAA
jgi:hypothetical protein